MSEKDEALFAVVRKAVHPGLLPKAVEQGVYLDNIRKIRELIEFIEGRWPPEIAQLKAAIAAARAEVEKWRDGDDMDEQWERLTDMVVRKAREQRDAARAEAGSLRARCQFALVLVRFVETEEKVRLMACQPRRDSSAYLNAVREVIDALEATPANDPCDIVAGMEAMREAGGKAWDGVADPEAYLDGPEA